MGQLKIRFFEQKDTHSCASQLSGRQVKNKFSSTKTVRFFVTRIGLAQKSQPKIFCNASRMTSIHYLTVCPKSTILMNRFEAIMYLKKKFKALLKKHFEFVILYSEVHLDYIRHYNDLMEVM